MQLNLIYARAANGVIGKDGQMPWHLPEDLAHFKRLTDGCPVIMGRKTWDSLPGRFKPLPGRQNLVITRQEHWNENGVQRKSSLGSALQQCESAPLVWVIGGAQIYAQALSIADAVEVTEIELEVEGDTFAPDLGSEWREVSRERQQAHNGTAFSFVRYERAERAGR